MGIKGEGGDQKYQKMDDVIYGLPPSSVKIHVNTLYSYTICILFCILADILELQENYAQDVLEYLQILDPGKTWRKSQIISRLRAITTALAKVSCTILI